MLSNIQFIFTAFRYYRVTIIDLCQVLTVTNEYPISFRSGAQGRNRTTDTGIFSPLLCRLSYLGFGKKSLVFLQKLLKKVKNFFQKATPGLEPGYTALQAAA